MYSSYTPTEHINTKLCAKPLPPEITTEFIKAAPTMRMRVLFSERKSFQVWLKLYLSLKLVMTQRKSDKGQIES